MPGIGRTGGEPRGLGGRSGKRRSHPEGDPSRDPPAAEGSPRVVQWAGFDYLARDESRPRFGTLALRRIVAPMWLPLVVTAALPSWRGWSWLKRRGSQRRAGLCPTCGYDLRGNVSGVCPECGAGR